MCHSQTPRPFERWINSMNEFWCLSEPLEIQSHYSYPLPRFQNQPHPGYASFMFPSPLLFKTYLPSNHAMPGWDKGPRVSSHQASAELTITRIPFIPATLVVCTQTAADVGVGTCLCPLDFTCWLLRPHPHLPRLSVIRYAL